MGRVFGVLVVLVTLAPTLPTASAQEVPTIYLYVNDLTDPHTLLSDEYGAVEDLCYEVDRLTGAEIAVLTVNTTLPMGIDTFAVQTFEANGIGKEGRDNGVLLVVSTDERQWRIEVGYGLEGILTDIQVGRIGRDNLTPYLQAGDFFSGIYEATYEIGRLIVDTYDAATPNEPQLFVLDWGHILIIVAVLVVIGMITRGRSFLWLGGLFRIFKRGGFGGGRSGGGGARGKW